MRSVRPGTVCAAAMVCAAMILACAAPALADPPMKFQVISGRADVFAEGEITPDTPKEFAAFLRGNPAVMPILVFNSGGGALFAALELGRLIRQAGWNTFVGTPTRNIFGVGPGECDSACTFVFLGGRTRSIGPGSRFGVHRFSGPTPGDPQQDTQKYAGQLVAYIREMGVSEEMYTLMTQAGPGDPKEKKMNYLDESTMRRLNIITSEVIEAKMTDVQGAAVLRLTDTDSGGRVTYGRIDFYCRGPRLFARASIPFPLDAFTPSQVSLQWTFSPREILAPVPIAEFKYLGKQEGKPEFEVPVMSPALEWMLLAKSVSVKATGPASWKPHDTEEDRVGSSTDALPASFSTLLQTLAKSCR